MKFKTKCFISFFTVLMCITPVKSYHLSAGEQNTPINYTNDYVGLYNEVKDGVVMIKNFAGTSTSSGTGMIYKEDDKYLYMMSNAHVIMGNIKVYVTFNNEEYKEAIVVGYDEYMDVAVLKCEKPSIYKVLTLANSAYSQIGEEIMAIGNPVSTTMEYSVSKGVISNLDLEVGDDDFYKTRFVTMVDMALNPGNSGGPSFNIFGHIVGINSVKFTFDGVNYYEGTNFMIPISEALNVATRIEQHKNHIFVRPYIGNGEFYNVEDLYLHERQTNGIPNYLHNGVYIKKLDSDNNSLRKASINENSIIVEFAGEKIENKSQLRRKLYSLNVFQKVSLKYYDLKDNCKLKTAYVEVNAYVFK